MITIHRSFTHPNTPGQTIMLSDQESGSFILFLPEETNEEIGDDYSISLPDVTSRQGILERKSKKDEYISSKQQPWAKECFKEVKALDVMTAQEGLPPPDLDTKTFAEFVLDLIVKFPDPFPRPQIYVDDDGAIVFYFVWQHSFVSLDFWPDKIWCLSTINGERREYLSPHDKKHNVIAPFFQELRRLVSEATKEGK